jgi:ABC-2 type transport system ATP-binding protein
MSGTSSQAGIVVSDLVKVYEPSPRWMRLLVRSNVRKAVRAVDGISFEVAPGEICAVLGPNGAGKTTTFRILVGLTTPTSGSSSVMGHDPVREPVEVRKKVGWMPGDQRALLMRHSVNENLRFHGKLQGISGEALTRSVSETLELVGLDGWGENTCFALSAGMRARLQLARALLHRPKVLILDEPTGAVDPVASHELVELIRDIVRERQIAALISSHRLEEIEALQSRVLLLDGGRVRYDGPLQSLRKKYARSQIDITFRDPRIATEARAALEGAEIGDVTQEGQVDISAALENGVTHSDIFRALSSYTEDIVSFTENEVALHTLLANIYRDTAKEAS